MIDENQQQIQLLKNEQEYIQERMDRFVAETAYDDIETFQSAFTQLKSAVDQFYQEKATLTERRDQLTTKIKSNNMRYNCVYIKSLNVQNKCKL